MDFSKVSVLLMDGKGRQTLTMLHEFKELGCRVAVLCSAKSDVCYASKLPDEKILYKDPLFTEDHFRFMVKLLSGGKYDVLVPIGDASTEFVTNHEDAFKKYTRLACAPKSAFDVAADKQRTLQTALKLGIPIAHTRLDGQDIEEFLDSARFPIVVKPRHGSGSVGFHKVDSREEYYELIQKNGLDIDTCVVQEYIDHERRHGTYIFVDQHGDMKSAVVSEVLRWYPIDAGTSTVSASIDDPVVLEYAGRLLKEIGWHGYANMGFMIEKSTGDRYLLEINGRIPAPMRLTWMCGINAAKQFLEMVYDQEVTDYGMNTKFGMMARHFQADFMWFLKSPDRFRVKPSWFSWKNTADLVYWKGDPKPAIVYTFHAIFGYGKFMKKRKR